VLEVGCGYGFLAYLFRKCGYEVCGTDAVKDDYRDSLFQRMGISYRQSNLNDVEPLADYPGESFDLVLLGEVFEHILNNPAGLLQSIERILTPGGLLILTTPNPSTLTNAVRVFRDTYLLWGTPEFLREVKFDHGAIIDKGEIHYREYPAWIVRDLLQQIGFVVCGMRYIRSGIAPTQTFQKRMVKRALELCGQADKRIFAQGYVIWARKKSHDDGPPDGVPNAG